MSFYIDIRTVLLVLALGHFFSGILIIAYIARNKIDKSINTFLISKSFELTAWILIILRDHIPDFLSVFAANCFLVVGTTLQCLAFLLQQGCCSKRVVRNYILLDLSFVAAFYFVTAWNHLESARVMVISIYIVIIWVYPVYQLLKDPSSSVLRRVTAILYGAAAATFIGRALAVLLTDEKMTLTSSTFYNALAFLSMYIVMLIGSIGFILLAKEKSDIELVKAATLDGMTGIYNRTTLLGRAREIVSLMKRKERPLTFLLLDIDHFKKVNDTYGHHAGDLVLVRFAAEIKGQLREYDLFGRFGGEEFVVLLPETGEAEGREVAERLRQRICETPVPVNNQEISYTVSIGVLTLIPDDNTTVEFLLNLSDKALYRAKESGRNRVEFI